MTFGVGGSVDAVRSLVEAVPCMALAVRGGQVVAANDAASSSTGLDPEECVPLERVFLGAFPDVAEGEPARAFDCLLLRQGQHPMAVQGAVGFVAAADCFLVVAMGRPSGDEGGQGTFLGDVLDSAPEAMAITHEGQVLHANREFVRLFGFAVGQCVGRGLDEMLLPEGHAHENEILQHMMAHDGRAAIDTVRRTREGELLDVALTVAPMRLGGGAAMGHFHTFRDIGRQKAEARRLEHDALHDGLTGLPNRVLFLDRLRLTMARLGRRPERHFAVMFLDVDGFKGVNDRLGHRAGDALLREVAVRLRGCLRPQDTVARFGGDEFALLLDEAGGVGDADEVARRVQAAVQRAVMVEGEEARVSASIGVAVVTDGGGDASEVLRDADLAMYQAKAGGKARHCFAGK